jgi:hypothetical protein
MTVSPLKFTMKTNLNSWLVMLAAVIAAPYLSAQTTEPVALSRQVVQKADHKIIFERIAPPVAALAKTPSGVVATTPQLPRKSLSLSCTVFNHEFTEVRWSDSAGAEYVIWSSIDFTPFMGRSSAGFEFNGVRYGLFLGLGDAAADVAAEPLALFRSLTPPKSEASWYVVRSAPESPSADAFEGINALHLYHDANKAAILAEHAQVKAANVARVAFAKAHPPVKQDTVIRFWPIQSVLHGVAAPITTEEAP